MPSSLIFTGLVVLWLLILVPAVARHQQEVARLSGAVAGRAGAGAAAPPGAGAPEREDSVDDEGQPHRRGPVRRTAIADGPRGASGPRSPSPGARATEPTRPRTTAPTSRPTTSTDAVEPRRAPDDDADDRAGSGRRPATAPAAAASTRRPTPRPPAGATPSASAWCSRCWCCALLTASSPRPRCPRGLVGARRRRPRAGRLPGLPAPPGPGWRRRSASAAPPAWPAPAGTPAADDRDLDEWARRGREVTRRPSGHRRRGRRGRRVRPRADESDADEAGSTSSPTAWATRTATPPASAASASPSACCPPAAAAWTTRPPSRRAPSRALQPAPPPPLPPGTSLVVVDDDELDLHDLGASRRPPTGVRWAVSG